MVILTSDGLGEPHEHRRIAQGFGDNAAAYDRVRPRYPQALAEAIVADLPGPSVLDVGIGTGLSALPFQTAGCTVHGVEPDARMARLAQDRGFPVDVGRFEDWEPAGRRFDGIISGQAWHWIDPMAGAVKAAQALIAGGRLAVFWNAADPPLEIREAFADVYRRVDPQLPFRPGATATSAADGYQRFLDAATTGMTACGAYGDPVPVRFDWQQTVTREAWLEGVPTSGGHQLIPPAQLAELLSGMAAVIDDAGGSFTMSYATVGVSAACLRPRSS